MITDSGSIDNIVYVEVVERLKLNTIKHTRVFSLQKGHEVLINEECEIELQFGKYKDNILCDVMPMDVCHIFSGRPWQCDSGDMHDGMRNVHRFCHNVIGHNLLPMH